MIKTALLTHDEAAARGYAEFNGCDHLCVDAPDRQFTITVRTSEGKRITFAFLPYAKDSAPQAVDICYHDSGQSDRFNDRDLPTFDMLLFGRTAERQPGGREPNNRFQLDTRQQPFKPGIACVLMDNGYERKTK